MADGKRSAPAPSGLGTSGRRLWRSVVGSFDLGPDEVATLREACRCADELERLRDELADSPLVTAGSAGQIVANPILEQVRRHRDLLGKLLGRLSLPVGDEDLGQSPTQRRAHRAAQARWRDRQAVKRAGRHGAA